MRRITIGEAPGFICHARHIDIDNLCYSVEYLEFADHTRVTYSCIVIEDGEPTNTWRSASTWEDLMESVKEAGWL